MRSLRTLRAPMLLMARSHASSSILSVSCPPLTVPRAKLMISSSPNRPSFRISRKFDHRLHVRSAALFDRPRNRKVAKEFSSRGMVMVSASAEEWKARLGIWIHSFSMDREVPKRFSKSAIDSSVRTGHLLEDMVGKEGKSGFGIQSFVPRVSF